MRGDKRRIPLLTPDLQLPHLTKAPEEPPGTDGTEGRRWRTAQQAACPPSGCEEGRAGNCQLHPSRSGSWSHPEGFPCLWVVPAAAAHLTETHCLYCAWLHWRWWSRGQQWLPSHPLTADGRERGRALSLWEGICRFIAARLWSMAPSGDRGKDSSAHLTVHPRTASGSCHTVGEQSFTVNTS